MARFSRGSLLCEGPIRIQNPRFNTMLTHLFRQEKIMEMECEVLISNFKNAKTIDLVNENIGRISSGSSSHSANALKLGLKKAFDLKNPRVKLRCSNGSCTWYSNPDSYSAMTSYGYYCQMCSNRGSSCYLQCAGCGYNRTGNQTACQRCRKGFR